MKILGACVLVLLSMGDAQAVSELTAKTELLACRPERQLNRVEQMRKSGDTRALNAFTTGALLSRTCIRLNAGVRVFAAGRGKGPGVIKIRPKGSFVTYFAVEENFE